MLALAVNLGICNYSQGLQVQPVISIFELFISQCTDFKIKMTIGVQFGEI